MSIRMGKRVEANHLLIEYVLLLTPLTFPYEDGYDYFCEDRTDPSSG